jgi:monoamine oxidase
MSDADVIVVGAGLAGLQTARRLADAGRRVLLLEAHSRAGGRVLTVHDGVDLGAEFIHGSPASTLGLLDEAGIPVIETTGTAWVGKGDRIEPARWASSDVHTIMRLAERLQSDMSVDDFLNRVVHDRPQYDDAARSIRHRVRGFDAADPARASIKAIASEWSGDASGESEAGRPRGGYGALVEHMLRALNADRVDVRYESAVRAIRWTKGAVEIDVERRGAQHIERARARAIVLTVSVGVLCAAETEPGGIRFEPPLAGKGGALDGVAMGPALKVMMRFTDPFWERIDGGRYADTSFFFTEQDATFPTFWTSMPARTSWLTAWVAGPTAAALSANPDDVIKAKALESVQALFANRVRVDDLLIESRVHNWQTDPFIRGAYSYTVAGGLSARRTLAAPIDDTLFFAGEATDDTTESTTVAGAISSGDRVAREVLGAVR